MRLPVRAGIALRKIAILGSTGSIGRQTLDIVAAHPDRLAVAALAAGRNNLETLAGQIRAFRPELVSVADEAGRRELLELMGGQEKVEVVTGDQGLVAVATHPAAQTVVTGLVGFLGVLPTAAAIRQGKTIALANKETLVAAGSVIMPLAARCNARIVPVDSEHSAIFQSLAGCRTEDISRIWLTASGGPFRTWSGDEIERATVDDALRHPNWSMGRKISVDSATLMNKGLEVIEARWLFSVTPQQVRVVIHPQSILHSAIEFVDGSLVGQMGLPDMRLPIHYALFWPERVPSQAVPRLDLAVSGSLTFEEPDRQRFPCLALAESVAGETNTLPCVFNAANEVAVEAFLQGLIRFGEIPKTIERLLAEHKPVSDPSLEDILGSDAWARQRCLRQLGAPAQQSVIS